MSNELNLTKEQMAFVKDVAGAIGHALTKLGKEPSVEAITPLIPAAMQYIIDRNAKYWRENKEQMTSDIFDMLKARANKEARA